MIALDSTALSLLFIPNAKAHSCDGQPIPHAKERMAFLVESVAQADDRILIPTPSLAEVLVKLAPAESASLLQQLRTAPWCALGSFDQVAAVEWALRTRDAIDQGDKSEGLESTLAMVKFDRQIVSIAIAHGAAKLISDDRDVAKLGQKYGLPVQSVAELDLPPQNLNLFETSHGDESS